MKISSVIILPTTTYRMRFPNFISQAVNNFLDMFSSDIGIDLGTATTLVYVKGEGIIINEASVVARDKVSHTIRAVGDEAKKMLGKTPGNIVAERPLQYGVIADFDVAEIMLRYFLRKAHPRKMSIRPRVVIAVPSGITEVERRAVKESALRAGAREIYLIEEPIAAAIGVGLPIEEPIGNMIVDIGGGTTEIAVISLGGIVCSESLRVGGDEMDKAIIDYMKKTYNLAIGERGAENVKIAIGSASPLEEEISLEVKGRDMVTGLPKAIRVDSEEIRRALQNPIDKIIASVKKTLDATPPELAADLIETGIVMCGGGSLLRGIDKLIASETGLPVIRAEDPLTAVALGAGKFLEAINHFRKLSIASQI